MPNRPLPLFAFSPWRPAEPTPFPHRHPTATRRLCRLLAAAAANDTVELSDSEGAQLIELHAHLRRRARSD